MPGTITETLPANVTNTDTAVDFLSTLDVSEDMNYQGEVGRVTKRTTALPRVPRRSQKTHKGTLSQKAWAAMHPIFTQITDHVTSQEAYDTAHRGLMAALGDVLAVSKSQCSPHGEEKTESNLLCNTGLASFPAVDRRKENKRLVPRTSPSRKRHHTAKQPK